MMKGAKGPPREGERAPEPASLTPGIAALLRRGNGEPKTEGQPPAPPQPAAPPGPTRGRRRLRISLWLADLLLLGLAARLVFRAHGSLGTLEAVLCVVALLLGAWLSCQALWLD